MHLLTELLLKWGAFGSSPQELWIVGSIPSDFSEMLTFWKTAVFPAAFWICQSLEQAIGLSLCMHMFKYTHAEQRERHGQAIFISILTLKWRMLVSIGRTCYCSVDKSLSKKNGLVICCVNCGLYNCPFYSCISRRQKQNLIFHASDNCNWEWINLHIAA